MTGKRYKKGMFIGRFQPFHLGHLEALKFALELCDELVIGIGSSNTNGTEDNPLDKETRVEIIRAALKDAGIDHRTLNFFHIPDFKSDDAWYEYIKASNISIDAVFSANEWVLGIFRNKNVAVVTPPLYRKDELSGVNVRECIRSGQPWEHLLTENAAGIVDSQKEKITEHNKTKQRNSRCLADVGKSI